MNVNEKPPLGWPKGSVRAVLALEVVTALLLLVIALVVQGKEVPNEILVLLGGVLATYGVLRTAQQDGESAGAGGGVVDAATFARSIADVASEGARTVAFEQSLSREQRMAERMQRLAVEVEEMKRAQEAQDEPQNQGVTPNPVGFEFGAVGYSGSGAVPAPPPAHTS